MMGKQDLVLAVAEITIIITTIQTSILLLKGHRIILQGKFLQACLR